MRFSRPSTGTILGATAVFIALGGTAFAAGATVVNIADPTTPANVAHVTAAGALQTTGSASITNTVDTVLAPPSAYLHYAAIGLSQSKSCVDAASPPSGRAMIIRDVRIDIYADPSPGAGQSFLVFSGPDCRTVVGDVTPATVGETTLPFDPGLAIAAGSELSVQIEGSLGGEIYTDAYSVPSSQVPAAPVGTARAQR